MQSLLEFRTTRGEINTLGCDTLSTRDAFALPIRRMSTIGWMTGVGTFETCPPALRMSVCWGRPEVAGWWSNRRDWSNWDMGGSRLSRRKSIVRSFAKAWYRAVYWHAAPIEAIKGRTGVLYVAPDGLVNPGYVAPPSAVIASSGALRKQRQARVRLRRGRAWLIPMIWGSQVAGDLSDYLIGFRVLASVRRRGPDLDRQTIVHKQLKGAVLQGGYHVPFRHSFNRRHYRHGTC